jgi:hypothetical protein
VSVDERIPVVEEARGEAVVQVVVRQNDVGHLPSRRLGLRVVPDKLGLRFRLPRVDEDLRSRGCDDAYVRRVYVNDGLHVENRVNAVAEVMRTRSSETWMFHSLTPEGSRY